MPALTRALDPHFTGLGVAHLTPSTATKAKAKGKESKREAKDTKDTKEAPVDESRYEYDDGQDENDEDSAHVGGEPGEKLVCCSIFCFLFSCYRIHTCALTQTHMKHECRLI